MGKALRHTDTGTGWIKRELRALRREIRESAAAKKLQAATIGRGGVTIKDGGGVTIKDNGAFSAQYPGGEESARFGPAHTADGRVTQALTIRHENGDVVFGANRTPYDPAFPAWPNGQTAVQAGGFSTPVDLFYVEATDISITGGTGSIIMAANGNIGLIPGFGTGGSVNIFTNTTGAGANAYLDPASGEIMRSTSSERYKRDIAAADVDVEQALKLTPRKFRMKSDESPDAPEFVGFIAEEADQLGLHAWVTSDADGPEAFSYPTWVVALQAIVQAQEARIQALEAALERRES